MEKYSPWCSIEKGLIWRIGDGAIVNFWNDTWTSDGLYLHFSDDVINTIVKKYLLVWTLEGFGADRLIWKGTSNGHFSVRSAFDILLNEGNTEEFPWSFLWKLPVPPKLKTLFWLLTILTNVERSKRKLTTNCSCPVCHDLPETLTRLLRDCLVAQGVWIDRMLRLYFKDYAARLVWLVFS